MRPRRDLIAAGVALAAAAAVIANAAFLQRGPHPAPLFPAPTSAKVPPASSTKPARAGQDTPAAAPVTLPKSRPMEAEAAREAPAVQRPATKSATPPLQVVPPPQVQRADPIAELIAPSAKRVTAVQRALAEYGYGQIRQTGVFGPETKDAIERFERARKMPVTGQISPRLLQELSKLTGRPIE